MKTLKLYRLPETGEGSPGVLMDNEGFPLCLTLERQWLDNKPMESCVPKGNYQNHLVTKPIHGICWEMQGVKDRSDILWHKGNIFTNSNGCILLGYAFDVLSGLHGIASSGLAYDKFMNYLKGETEFTIIIQ